MTEQGVKGVGEKYCGACGRVIVQDAAFCSQCGAEQRATPVQQINVNVGSKQTNMLALIALVLSVLIFFTGGITWIPAIICGHIARNSTKRDPNIGGGGMATAALIISYLVLIAVILVGCVIGLIAATAE